MSAYLLKLVKSHPEAIISQERSCNRVVLPTVTHWKCLMLLRCILVHLKATVYHFITSPHYYDAIHKCLFPLSKSEGSTYVCVFYCVWQLPSAHSFSITWFHGCNYTSLAASVELSPKRERVRQRDESTHLMCCYDLKMVMAKSEQVRVCVLLHMWPGAVLDPTCPQHYHNQFNRTD